MVGLIVCACVLAFAPRAQEGAANGLDAAAAALMVELRSADEERFRAALAGADAFLARHSAELRFAELLPLTSELHARLVARGDDWLTTSAWSAEQLALFATRAGRHELAEEVLSERIAVLRRARYALRGDGRGAALDPALAALHDRRALSRLSAGDLAGGEADLAAALALGSTNARLVLGRRALAAGRLERARRLFGTLEAATPPHAWARRGWGLTMLPPPRR